ncbi:MAG: L,D-transpeptidase family protein [Alkalilacustris sp.]
MQVIRVVMALLGLAVLAGCADRTEQSRFLTYDGPEVTRILVWKEARVMQLRHHDVVLMQVPINLGFDPVGHKQRRGDGRTPEGHYIIDRRNPNSAFHLSLGISYPDVNDKLVAKEAGDDPGGDIFIHGTGPRFRNATGDWTAGCIAVTDEQMEKIFAMVRVGTPISIFP